MDLTVAMWNEVTCHLEDSKGQDLFLRIELNETGKPLYQSNIVIHMISVPATPFLKVNFLFC